MLLDIHVTEHSLNIQRSNQSAMSAETVSLLHEIIPGQKSLRQKTVHLKFLFFLIGQPQAKETISLFQKFQTDAFFFFCFFEDFFCKGKIRHCLEILFCLYLFSLILKSGKKVFKLQLFEKFIGLLGIEVMNPCLLPVQFHRTVGIDGRQLSAQHCQIIMLQKGVLGFLGLDFLHMGIGIFCSTVFQKKLCGSFLTHSRKSGNIVGRISHQGFQLYDLRRRKLVGLFYIFCIIVLNSSLSSLCLGNPDTDIFRSQLKEIPVTGKNGHIHSLGFAFLCQRSQDIVCLISFFRYNIDSHGFQHVFHHRHLFPQLSRHRLSGPFVGIIHFMAEGRGRKVKGYCKVIGILLLQHFK